MTTPVNCSLPTFYYFLIPKTYHLKPLSSVARRAFSRLSSNSLPHRCIAYRIRDERKCYRPFFGGVDVGNVERVKAV